MAIMNADLAAALIAAQFPELAGADVLPLGEGYDSQAFEVAGRWIFRFPKRADVAASLARESALLAQLAPRLPLAVPDFRFLGHPGRTYPHPFVGFEKLQGTIGLEIEPSALPVAIVGATLGRFLRELHGFAEAEARSLGVVRDDSLATSARRDEALADLQIASAEVDSGELARWRKCLATPPPACEAPVCLVHNDLAAEHILLDASGRPTGVIDWGDAAFGDPAVDFAGLMHWAGEPLARAAFTAYGAVGDALLARARWLAACRGVADIVFGLKFGRPRYIAAGLRALREIT